ncbi:DUF6683 family protein [Piscinibacter terrae]|uniref:Uncharacterized protein n=1 Tax=Piscinibacter terrae TaxID=2496871 RepID=A0A3N7HSU7_9BURK|nr:DUF6683 family protein [Albitalea terrae]RQP25370.1 hypothetical protein DZC73_11140 [Albitalea terrae]
MRIRHTILVIAALTCAAPCFADGFVNVYEIPSSVSLNVITNQLYHEQLNKTLHHWDNYEAEQKRKRAAAAAGLPPAQATGAGIAELTKNLPKDQAEKGRAAYRQAFEFHEQVIKKFGLHSGDLGVAMASCIAGAWMAYHNKPFPDEHFLGLVNQMRQLVGSNDALRSVSAAERSSTYESLAVTGMILASSQITWQRNPQAAGADDLRLRMRQQGADTLTRMLQIDPERVGIGAAGVYALKG